MYVHVCIFETIAYCLCVVIEKTKNESCCRFYIL